MRITIKCKLPEKYYVIFFIDLKVYWCDFGEVTENIENAKKYETLAEAFFYREMIKNFDIDIYHRY
ncbi:hypothetical protein ES703_65436 [subsurface metagenome]